MRSSKVGIQFDYKQIPHAKDPCTIRVQVLFLVLLQYKTFESHPSIFTNFFPPEFRYPVIKQLIKATIRHNHSVANCGGDFVAC